MADIKLVIGTKEGKSFQSELKGPVSEVLHGKRIGETISGDELGFAGYEFLITGAPQTRVDWKKCRFHWQKKSAGKKEG